MAPFLTTFWGKLYGEDVVEFLRHIQSDFADLFFADPPFNLGKDYGDGTFTDARTPEEYLAWCREWIAQGVRTLRVGGSFFLYNIPSWACQLAPMLTAQGLTYFDWIVHSVTNRPPIRRRLYPAHYALLWFVKGDRPRVFNRVFTPFERCRHCGGMVKDYGGHIKDFKDEGVGLKDVWDDVPPVFHTKHKGGRRANMLSPKFMHRVLSLATNPGELVIDAFTGSGTMPAECERTSRRWLATDKFDHATAANRVRSVIMDIASGALSRSNHQGEGT